jgi:DNA-binding GntR family transcriptional regulator
MLQAEFQVPRVLAQELANFLEQQIVYLELPPETRLVEEDVGQRYGVSRSPVRDAFRILEADGLVVRAARHGVWVASLTSADADEIYACRLLLEELAVELAAKNNKPEAASRLSAVYERMQAATGDVRAYFEAGYDFNVGIHRLAGNHTLARLLDGLGKRSRRYRFLAYSKFPYLVEASVKGNGEILNAIRACDSRAAKAVTRKLIQNSWNEISEYLKHRPLTSEGTTIVSLPRSRVSQKHKGEN